MRRWVVLVVIVVAVATGCWYQEGFDGAHSGFNPLESALTTANVRSLTRAWGADAGAPATTPVRVGSSVYTSAGDAVIAYDARGGTVRWRSARLGLTQPLGPLTSRPEGLVTAAYGDVAAGGYLTFDLAGGAPTGSLARGIHGLSPVAARGADTATIEWYQTSGQTIRGLRWNTQVLDDVCCHPTPNAVSIIGARVVTYKTNTVVAYLPDTCPDGTQCLPAWSTPLAGPTGVPVGIDDTRVAVSQTNGNVTVLDATTGAVLFTVVTGGSGLTAPAVANGWGYVGGGGGAVHAFPTSGCGSPTCAPTWSVATGGAAISHQPAIAADVVYVGTANGRIHALAATGCGLKMCPTIWSGTVDDGVSPGAVQGPIVVGGAVFAATTSGKVAAFRSP